MSYPSTLSYLVKRIAGHTTNNYRLKPQGSESASPQGIVRFDLPNNAIIDLKEVRFMFQVAVSGASASHFGRLPNKISSLIDRVTISVGGQQIYQGHSGYNQVKHIKDALELGKVKELSTPMTHENVELTTGTSYVDGSTALTAQNETNALTNPFCVGGGDLLGFFEGMPRMLDMSLLPQATIEFTFAPASVLVYTKTDADTDPDAGSATYSVSNMRLLTQAYGLNDGGAYDAAVNSEIMNNQFVEFSFKEYYTFFDESFSGSTRFSLPGVQSLDKLYAAFHASAYTTQGVATVVEGRTFTEDKRVAKYFNWVKPTNLTGLQFQINGAFYPTYSANPDECLALTAMASEGKDGWSVVTPEQYLKNYFIFAQRFNHPELGKNMITGLDFSNINMAGSLVGTTSGAVSVPIIIVAECTSTLRIGSQLQAVKIA